MRRPVRKRPEAPILKKRFYCTNRFENYLTFMSRLCLGHFRTVNMVESPISATISRVYMVFSIPRRDNIPYENGPKRHAGPSLCLAERKALPPREPISAQQSPSRQPSVRPTQASHPRSRTASGSSGLSFYLKRRDSVYLARRLCS